MHDKQRPNLSFLLASLTILLVSTSGAHAGDDPNIIRVIPDYEANEMTIYGSGFVDEKDQLEQEALGCNNCLPPVVRIGHGSDPGLSLLTVDSYETESESAAMPKLDRPGKDKIVVELPDLEPGDYKLWVAQNHDTDSDSDSAIKKADEWDLTLVGDIKGDLCAAIPAQQRPSFCTNIVFVTSVSYRGDLGGLAGADMKCNQLAAGANLPGTYIAWLSGDNTNARDRITDSAYSRVDGVLVASSLADLTDGNIAAPINLDETGGLHQINTLWTGTRPSGHARTHFTCNSWTTDGYDYDDADSHDDANSYQSEGSIGNPFSSDESWTDRNEGESRTCNADHGFYCFQQ